VTRSPQAPDRAVAGRKRARGKRTRAWLHVARARILVAIVALLAAGGWGSPARAEASGGALTSSAASNAPNSSEDVEKSPRDVPIVVQPSAIVIPALPDTDQVRDLGWLRVAYPPSAHERVQPLLDEANDVKAQLADELGQPVLSRPIEVRIARSPEDMTSLSPSELPPPAYASAVALPGLRLVLLSMRAPDSQEGTNLSELFRHELAHIALDDAVGAAHVPLWFNEGFAVHASNEDPVARLQSLTSASLSKSLIPLHDLDRNFPSDHYEVSVAYAESADFVRYLLRQADRARFAAMIERTRNGEAFERSLADAYGTDARRLEYEWREELAKRYTFWPVLLSGSIIWVLVLGALGVGLVRKKQRDRATLARWEREEREETEEAARRAAIAAAIQTEPPPRPDGQPITASIPKIEHEGDWHTLH
jgi:hypothetical protein